MPAFDSAYALLALRVAIAAVLSFALHAAVWRLLGSVAARTATDIDDAFARHLRAPSRLLVPALVVKAVLHAGGGVREDPLLAGLAQALNVVIIAAVAWTLLRSMRVLRDVLVARYRVDDTNNLAARRVHTQIDIINRVVGVVVLVVSAGAILTLFDSVRQIGTGLLASAGIAGVVVGLSAQRMLTNLLAGIQIAFTQPIRLEDVVIVENEWGWIEEISLTYVVVRIWDLRRLIVPISYFIEKPFQNWTRSQADILGTVVLHCDYAVPVDALRDELQRVVGASPLWDGKVANIQVTDCRPTTMEVRALVSASDSGKSWDLRCLVREKLVAFVSRDFPEALPRTRAEVRPPAVAAPRKETA